MAKSQLRSERKTSEPVGGGGGGRGSGGGGGGGSGGALLCTVINLVSQMRDIFSGPETNLHDCLDAFFEPSELKGYLYSTHTEIGLYLYYYLYFSCLQAATSTSAPSVKSELFEMNYSRRRRKGDLTRCIISYLSLSFSLSVSVSVLSCSLHT